jgi:hypothetical protein
MTYVLSVDYALDAGASLGTINMTPYAIRDEQRGTDANNWKGAALAGTLMGFDYDAEYAKYDNGDGGADGTAWALATSIDLDVLSSVPGITNGGIDISMSSADGEFDTNGALAHGVGGFGDHSGGGAWDNGNDITSIGLNFSPAEGWGGRIALHDVESDEVGAKSYKETDISVNHDFGGNVAGWFGYAMIDEDLKDDSVTFWTTLSVSF